MQEKNMEEIKKEIGNKLLSALQEQNSFEGTDITIHSKEDGSLYFKRNLELQTDLIVKRNDFDFTVISDDVLKSCIEGKGDFKDGTLPFGQGDVVVCKNYIGAKEHLMWKIAVDSFYRSLRNKQVSGNYFVRRTGYRNTLLFLSTFKNTVHKGSVVVNLLGKDMTLKWVAIHDIILFENGLILKVNESKVQSGYCGGVTSAVKAGLITSNVVVSFCNTKSNSVYSDVVKNAMELNDTNIKKVNLMLDRSLLLYSLFNIEGRDKSPVQVFGCNTTYSVGCLEDNKCTDFSDFYGDDRDSFITLDGYLGTTVNVSNLQVVTSGNEAWKERVSPFNTLFDVGLIEPDECYNGSDINYLDIFDE